MSLDANSPVTVAAPDPSERTQAEALTGRSPDHGDVAAAWHALWALAVATGAAILLLASGDLAPRPLTALALGAAPGLLGFFYRPRTERGRMGVMAGWTLACALAVSLTGGVSGPLAVWLLTPLLAALVYGGLWRTAAGQAFAALTAVAMIQAGGRTGAAPAEGLGLGVVALATTAALGAGGLMMRLAGRPAEEAPSAEPERAGRVSALVAERDAALADARGKMQFLANMSHELRTPLNAIMGFSDMMRAKVFGELSPRYAEYAELIHEGGAHLLDLINDVLDASKIEADRYELACERLDAREPVNAALRILRPQADHAGVQLRGVAPGEPVEVEADRRALKQIVLNLVSNALKFTPAGGAVSVTLAVTGRDLELAVADTGVGVAPEDLARLGRPYEQAGDAADRAQGTGLGLSLVRAFARLHGGEMALESRLGEGTAVTVRLPVVVAAGDGGAGRPA